MAHIAWLGKKSPFCGNVTYGLSTTYALRSRGHGISFIHFDTPAGRPSPTTLAEELRVDSSDSPGSGPDGLGGGPEVALPLSLIHI